MFCDSDTQSNKHLQATLFIFASLALPTAIIVGSKGSQYWLTGVETGAIVGGIGAGIFYFATGGNIFQSIAGDGVGVMKSAVCGVLQTWGL